MVQHGLQRCHSCLQCPEHSWAGLYAVWIGGSSAGLRGLPALAAGLIVTVQLWRVACIILIMAVR